METNNIIKKENNTLSQNEILEKIKELNTNLEQIQSILEREKEDITKLQNVKQLNSMKINLKNKINYYKDLLNYEIEKTSYNINYIYNKDDIGKACNVFYNDLWLTGRIEKILTTTFLDL